MFGAVLQVLQYTPPLVGAVVVAHIWCDALAVIGFACAVAHAEGLALIIGVFGRPLVALLGALQWCDETEGFASRVAGLTETHHMDVALWAVEVGEVAENFAVFCHQIPSTAS